MKSVRRILNDFLPCGAPALLLSLPITLSGCGVDNFDSWHTDNLPSEFTAEQADLDFAGYQALEQQLDRELQSQVYASVPTNDAYRLVRYSNGSASDPRMTTPNWNQSFSWPATEAQCGVLLLHGMSDSPYSLRTIARALHGQACSVIGLRFPGHGTVPAGIARAQWQDLQAATTIAWRHLTEQLPGKPLHLVGFSTGAALAIDLALAAAPEEQASSLVLISPAVGLQPAAALAGVVSWLSRLPGLGALGWTSVEPEFDPYKYNSFPVNAADIVYQLARRNADRVAKRAQSEEGARLPPTLILKSVVDATVSIDAVVDKLLALLAPGGHELILFDINRLAPTTALLVNDPAPIVGRLMSADSLPFDVTVLGNAGPDTRAVQVVTRRAGEREPDMPQPLGSEWPLGVFSLSHIALPISPDDGLYGAVPPENEQQLFLGQMSVQGERGLLRIPGDYFLRLRYNPFYDYLEQRTLAWVARHSVTDAP